MAIEIKTAQGSESMPPNELFAKSPYPASSGKDFASLPELK